ncbi:unnamed protein product [Brugia pahangi]|uniref:Secreted protein n=1 Tax=Brugia pahangi TaxID=6280 RepID=A0A0N4T496_BRUPA|nr:unnamed protein product [Brugia pahangi]
MIHLLAYNKNLPALFIYFFITSHCKSNDDPNTDCIGAYFVQTDGKSVHNKFCLKELEISNFITKNCSRIQQCIEHKDCYDYREPILWCRPNPEQKWMKDGCHCDLKLHSCIINRQSYGRLEYTHCRSAFNWYCP